jgi:uncharacterized protein YcfJ
VTWRVLPVVDGQRVGGVEATGGAYWGGVVGHDVAASRGEWVGCGGGIGGGGGKEEATWQQLRAVSAFGRGRAAGPEGGIYLLKSPL